MSNNEIDAAGAAKDYNMKNGYRYLVISLMMYLIVSVVNCWTNFATPIGKDLDWTETVLGLNYTIKTLCMGFGAMLGGVLAKRKPVRFTMTLAAIMYGLGYLGSSMVQTDSPVILYVSYGILAAAGCGMTMNAMNNCVAQWFPNDVGYVSGIMMLASGISALILGTTTSYLVDAVGWRIGFRIIGGVSFVVLIICAFILRLPKAGEVPPRKTGQKKQPQGGYQEIGPLQMLKKPSFWMFFIWTSLMFGITVVQGGTARQVADSIATPKFLASLGIGFIMLFNGVGAIIAGHLYDTQGRKRVMLIQNSGFLAGILIAMAGIHITSPLVLVLGWIVMGLTGGGVGASNAAFIAEFYGMKNFAINLSILNERGLLSAPFATIAGAIVVAYGSYIPVYYMLIVMAVIALILGQTFKNA